MTSRSQSALPSREGKTNLGATGVSPVRDSHGQDARGTRRRVLPLVLPAGLLLAALLVLVAIAPWALLSQGIAAPPAGAKTLDPAAWGGDHVGQAVPAYMESGECLFCHREAVGNSWHTNKHNRTVRTLEADEPAIKALAGDPSTKTFAKDVDFLIGDTRAQRFLKKSPVYGKFDLLSVVAEFGRGQRARLVSKDQPHWDDKTFATACAGCHTTGVDPESHAFSAPYIDCFSCHGDAPEEHSNDPKLMPLAKARKDSPAVVTSICASCHVRFGKSKATGLAYPTNFVAGDNLFRDFQVDWSVLDDPKLNPADAHVLDNVRDVVVYGQESTTCLSCHDVHTGSSAKHRDLPVVRSCQHCHTESVPIKGHKNYDVHSQRCGY